jgi:ribose 5-phosphate isomerase B
LTRYLESGRQPVQNDEIRNMVRKAVQQALGGASSPSAPQRSQVSGRKFITEADVQGLFPGSELVVPSDALLTPLARDLILQLDLTLRREGQRSRPAVPSPAAGPGDQPATDPEKTVALGADHGGYALKEALKSYLQELGYAVLDCGTHSSESVDYPDFAYAVATAVSEGRAARGVMVDGAGIGSCMAANKVPGVRAAMCYDLSTAVNSREHNDANVLTLGGGLIGGNLARQIVKTWLSTGFGGGRHARRVDKIMAIEQRDLKN